MPLLILVILIVIKAINLIGWPLFGFGFLGTIWWVFYGAAPTWEDPAKLRVHGTFTGSRAQARLYILRLLSTRPDEEKRHTITEYNEPKDDGYAASTTTEKGVTRWWHLFREEHLDDNEKN